MTPIEAWPVENKEKKPKTPPPPKIINTYQNRHQTQVEIINEQKRRLKEKVLTFLSQITAFKISRFSNYNFTKKKNYKFNKVD